MMRIKRIRWSEEKNTFLKKYRDISFEEVQIAIEGNGLLATIPHPNKKKYPHQKMFIVVINEYTFSVPFVEDDEKIFLKTAYPDRKYMYLIK